MRAVDSSAWIEWLIDSPIADSLGRELPEPAQCLVPTMVQHELTKWLLREKGEEAADAFLAFSQTCVVVPLDAPLAVEAAYVARQHRLATADAIIYATAQRHGADLLTCDVHFDGLPDVIYLRNKTT